MGRINIGACATCFYKNDLLLSDINYGGLYSYDFQKREIKLIYFFDDVITQEEMHQFMVLRDLDIYLFPYNDNAIRIINVITKEEKRIFLLPELKKPIVYSNKNNVWLVSNKEWYYFDFSDNSLKIDDKLTDFNKQIVCEDEKKLHVNLNDEMVIICDNENKNIHILSFDNNKKITLNTDEIKEKIQDVFWYKSKLWFVLNDSQDIYSREINNPIYIKYRASDSEYISFEKLLAYSSMICWNDNLILTNYYGKNIMKIDENKKTVDSLFNDESCFEYNMDLDYGAVYYDAISHGEYLYFIPQRGKYIIKCDRDLNIVDKYALELDINKNNVKDGEIILSNNNRKILYEERNAKSGLLLTDYLEYLSEYKNGE